MSSRGVDALAKVSGLAPDEIRAIALQVKANTERLKACTGHDFAPVPGLPALRRRYRCRQCQGEIDHTAHTWYQRGILDAHPAAEPAPAGRYEPHQQRVMDERNDLATRLAKLQAYTATEQFQALASGERVRLLRQHDLMGQLLAVLDSRIMLF